MTIDMELLHAIILYILYAAFALASFVVVERLIFFWATLQDARRLEAAFTGNISTVSQLPATLMAKRSLPVEAVQQMLKNKASFTSHAEMEDFSQSVYIVQKGSLHRHLWILDTVVTAAPLLGLLGTILGIIDTFTALAQSSVSDPALVSRGIGTALYATALGISVALYGLIFHNMFQMRITAITDLLKVLLLRAGIGRTAAEATESKAKALAYAH